MSAGPLTLKEHAATSLISLVCANRRAPQRDCNMVSDKNQGIKRDERGQDQPADKERAQTATSVEEKKRTEEQVRKLASKSGF